MFRENFIFPLWLRIIFFVGFSILLVSALCFLFDACLGQTYMSKEARKGGIKLMLLVTFILFTIFLLATVYYRNEIWK